MTTIDGYPNTRARGDEAVADIGRCRPEQLLLIATMGAWRTLGELDKLAGSADLEALRPADYQSWLKVRGAIAQEMLHLCALLDVLDPSNTLRRPGAASIADGPTAPAGSPPAACPAAQPEAPLVTLTTAPGFAFQCGGAA